LNMFLIQHPEHFPLDLISIYKQQQKSEV